MTQNVDLDTISPEILTGEWLVETRVLPSSSQSMFNDVTLLELYPNIYRCNSCKIIEGEWSVVKEKEIIYNPQLKFVSGDETVGKAIITRLYSETSLGALIYKLTLYFTTGLELVLKKSS